MPKIELIQGDCLEKMKDIPDGSIDLVLIDPPYCNMVSQSWDRMTDEKAKKFFEQFKEESYRVLRFGGKFISFSSNDTLNFLYGGNLLHRELLVICKDAKKVSAGRNTKLYKQHINCAEYVFVATKYQKNSAIAALTIVKNTFLPILILISNLTLSINFVFKCC